jgi:type IV secretion system protein VirB2
MICANKRVLRTHWTRGETASTFTKRSNQIAAPEGFMKFTDISKRLKPRVFSNRGGLLFLPLAVVLLAPLAHAQGSPFDTGFNALQTLFTGTIAKVASLIAIVIGGYGFAHGEPGAKKALAGVAAGTGIAVLAVNVLSWLWGV